MPSLEQVVRELLVAFHDAGDWPAGHRCTKNGPHRCTHHLAAGRSLLDRLTALVMPGTTFTERMGQRLPRAGSPAPWDPRPAELRDEILRGAVRLSARAREVLGRGGLRVSTPLPLDHLGYPVALGYGRMGYRWMPVSVAPVELAGRAALRELPGLVLSVQELDPAHFLVRGELVDGRDPARGYRLGKIEARLRMWHAQAQRVAGYDEAPPEHWHWMDNPLPEVAWPGWVGPLCPQARPPRLRRRGSARYAKSVGASDSSWHSRFEQLSCGHSSCLRIAYAAMGALSPAWCPWCWRRSLVEDPVSGAVRCDRDHVEGSVEWGSRSAALGSITATIRAELGVDADGSLAELDGEVPS